VHLSLLLAYGHCVQQEDKDTKQEHKVEEEGERTLLRRRRIDTGQRVGSKTNRFSFGLIAIEKHEKDIKGKGKRKRRPSLSC
jgi:hypothetical protein